MGLLGGLLKAYLGGVVGKAMGGAKGAKDAKDAADAGGSGLDYKKSLSPGQLRLDTSFMGEEPKESSSPYTYSGVELQGPPEPMGEYGGSMPGESFRSVGGADMFRPSQGPIAGQMFDVPGGDFAGAQDFAYPQLNDNDLDGLVQRGAIGGDTAGLLKARAMQNPGRMAAENVTSVLDMLPEPTAGLMQPSGPASGYAGPMPTMEQMPGGQMSAQYGPAMTPEQMLAMRLRGY